MLWVILEEDSRLHSQLLCGSSQENLLPSWASRPWHVLGHS